MFRNALVTLLVPVLILASAPAFAMPIDLPHLTFPVPQPAAGTSSGR